MFCIKNAKILIFKINILRSKDGDKSLMKLENICFESILLIILCLLNNKHTEIKLCVKKNKNYKISFRLKKIIVAKRYVYT